MLISFSYYLLIFLEGPILLGIFKLVYEVHYLLGLDDKYYGCRADGDFILDGDH